jgi:hypothetical protein
MDRDKREVRCIPRETGFKHMLICPHWWERYLAIPYMLLQAFGFIINIGMVSYLKPQTAPSNANSAESRSIELYYSTVNMTSVFFTASKDHSSSQP